VTGDELAKRMEGAAIFFKFYGPGRNVVKGMSELAIGDPSKGPNGPKQTVTIEQLKQQVHFSMTGPPPPINQSLPFRSLSPAPLALSRF
jgi:hypothetical protein